MTTIKESDHELPYGKIQIESEDLPALSGPAQARKAAAAKRSEGEHLRHVDSEGACGGGDRRRPGRRGCQNRFSGQDQL